MEANRDAVNEWMEKFHHDRKWLADKCGVGTAAVSNWLRDNNPRPIPAKATLIIESLMKEDYEQARENEIVPQNLVLEFTREEFDSICLAAQKDKQLPRAWAQAQLAKLADVDINQVITELRAVAEDEQHYGNTKSHIRAAAGSPVNCEVIDWDGSSPILNVEVYGLSMDPLFHDGQIIHMKHKSAARSQFMKKGLIYLIRHNGGFMIKRYNTRRARPDEKDAEYLTKTGTVGILESINPDFKPIDITDPDGTEWIAWYDEKKK